MRQQGRGNTVQRVDEGVRTVPHLAALRALAGAAGDWADALCGATPGDGLGGRFHAEASTEEADDDASVIITPSGVAWLREPGGGGGPVAAIDVTYDNGATGLPADNVQEAIDIFAKFTESVTSADLTSAGSWQPTAAVTYILLNASLVVNLTSPRTGVFRLVFQQDGTGGWAAEINGLAGWPGGAPYVPTATANAIDIVDLTSLQGTTYANVLGLAYAIP